MPEKLFRVAVAELLMVRVTCHHCGNAAEVTLDQLRIRFEKGECKFCGESLGVRYNGESLLTVLADTVKRLQDNAKSEHGAAVVEFVLPDAP